jgi:parallel beta-helix repeat protein
MRHRALVRFPLALALSLFMNSVVLAASLYVDNSGAPSCSNSPTGGSESKPWCTINYGIGRMGSGDTLYVKGGTYREDVYFAGPAGAAGSSTVIRAYPGHAVTILGSGIDSGRVKISNTSYVTFDGLIITNFNQGLYVESSHDVVVQNCIVHHVGQEGIHVGWDSSFVTIQDSVVHDTRQWQYNGEGIYVGQGSTAPRDNSHHVTIRRNTIYNTADEAIELKSGTHDNVIEGNTIHNALTDPKYGGGGSNTVGSIEVDESSNGNQSWGANPNHIVRDNRVYDTFTGIRAGTGTTVYNNLVYGIANGYYGIYVNNLSGDAYTRAIYHNTVDLPSARAIVIAGGVADVRNNIGPSTTNNMPTSTAYYVNQASADFRLVAGSAPIGAGIDLTSVVPTDVLGVSRLEHMPPDRGAYEYAGPNGGPAAPTGLVVQ